ncbi:hypothetical protein [Streptomyces scabiei]|uniref:hypothetical protein n=1 Tax=Streptomyces scabiei TaxID=1930 RepID=UPI0029AB760F|nr:hypothetical protein [Streptomyces scabiei]MDX2531583.1 hypothetical protein [Streptomyces scabiei]MDX2796641.1 hypothetical protein [Streptomyces scabiei]MDX2855877.1 hypothetical protein [Streptomyces scabiei]MDX3824571.1 hypothetical protein [Streptomyces scabiei]
MEVMPSGISVILYALTCLCAVALVTLWVLTNRSRRTAGFASKGHLKRHMSANAVVKATEIRPSLSRGEDHPAHMSAVSLAKDRSAGS